MGLLLKKNAVNQIPANTIIFNAKQEIDNVALILKGRVIIVQDNVKMTVSSGYFLGLADLYNGTYLFDSIAGEEVMLYVFDARKPEDIMNVLQINKDYSGLLISSLNNQLNQLIEKYELLEVRADSIYHMVKRAWKVYKEVQESYGHKAYQLPLADQLTEYEAVAEINRAFMPYIKQSTTMPLDLIKNYYSYGTEMAEYDVCERAAMLTSLTREMNALCNYVEQSLLLLINHGNDCLYKIVAVAAKENDTRNKRYTDLIILVKELMEEIKTTATLLKQRMGLAVNVDMAMVEALYSDVINGENQQDIQLDEKKPKTEVEISQLLRNSLDQILKFSKLDAEFAKEFESMMEWVKATRHNMGIDTETRNKRKHLADMFFKLYEAVFMNSLELTECPLAVELFLQYAFIDETLLEMEQLVELCNLEELRKDAKYCHVYSMKDWLMEIYLGNKEPSKNEFDEEYLDMIRKKVKTHEITPEMEQEYLTNNKVKVRYEIDNMFRYNMRLVNGKITTFVPVLMDVNIIGHLKDSFVSVQKLDEEIEKVLLIDYSLFYREVMYSNPEKGITKELIMEEYFPDIIIMPTVGTQGIMWQEIAGKKRASSGRFMLPAFAEGRLSDIILKLLARFRWELCRAVQGMSWNDIKHKSLTSEYCDFIQFFRKNKDLSEEKKEKVKSQLQKARNSSKEFFVIDYENWIRYESIGSVRLNKVVREILFTYCPFSKDIRQGMLNRPMFEQAMTRFNLQNAKKIKEWEIKTIHWQKDKLDVPEELLKTKAYYLEM